MYKSFSGVMGLSAMSLSIIPLQKSIFSPLKQLKLKLYAKLYLSFQIFLYSVIVYFWVFVIPKPNKQHSCDIILHSALQIRAYALRGDASSSTSCCCLSSFGCSIQNLVGAMIFTRSTGFKKVYFELKLN